MTWSFEADILVEHLRIVNRARLRQEGKKPGILPRCEQSASRDVLSGRREGPSLEPLS